MIFIQALKLAEEPCEHCFMLLDTGTSILLHKSPCSGYPWYLQAYACLHFPLVYAKPWWRIFHRELCIIFMPIVLCIISKPRWSLNANTRMKASVLSGSAFV